MFIERIIVNLKMNSRVFTIFGGDPSLIFLFVMPPKKTGVRKKKEKMRAAQAVYADSEVNSRRRLLPHD